VTEVFYDGGTPFDSGADGTTTYSGGGAGAEFSTTDGVIDYTLPLGKVRLLILDTAELPGDRLFSDTQLDAFLDMNGQSVRRTAAQALLTVAMSEALLSKKIRTQDLTTDGPAVAAELRAQAAVLAGQADAEDAAAQESFFEIVPGSSDYAEAAERYVW
jgi:hypothetical protein